MRMFSPAITEHVKENAPAAATGAVDYAELLRRALPQIDFYDTRRHLATLTGPELVRQVNARASALAARGLSRGDRIVMVAANHDYYLTTLLAVLLLGAVPCAVAPPPTPSDIDSVGVRHLQAAIKTVDPKMVVTQSRIAVAVSHPNPVTYGDIDSGDSTWRPRELPPAPNDVHHIQLTSGSTATPKAVLLTHGNVTHNMAAIGYATGVVRGRDRAFSWLPMYHDMGFIQVLCALLYGLPTGLMTPLGFLRDPLSWVRHLTEHSSTHTAGPPFAYRAATEALRRSRDGAAGINLSALKCAYVGAEPIPYSTLRSFTETFAPLGLSHSVLVPCYGMAESVLATTLALKHSPEGPKNFGRVRVLQPDPARPPLVSCGPPADGIRVRIVDSDGTAVPAGTTGNIQVSGASIMLGYQCPDGTVTGASDSWYDTGDQGFLSEGELFVVGRRKEMLIIRGRNLPPYDVELAIDNMPEVGLGRTVVISIPDAGRGQESIIAVVGTDSNDDDAPRLRTEIAAVVRRAFGFSLDEVVLVPSGAIPRTTSGKLQRLKVRQLYFDGYFRSIDGSN